MKRLFVLHLLIIASMLALLLVAVTPAFADTREFYVIPMDETDIWPADENPCSFDILIHTIGTWRVILWFDENGTFTHAIQIYGNLKQTLSANGKSLNQQLQGPVIFFLEDNQYIRMTVGTYVLTTVPGYGKIWGGAGQLVEEVTWDPDTGEFIPGTVIKWVGNTNFDDFSPGCEYLSP